MNQPFTSISGMPKSAFICLIVAVNFFASCALVSGIELPGTNQEISASIRVRQDELKLPLNWKSGDQRNYRITKHLAKLQRDGSVDKTTTCQDISIKVVKENDKSLVVAWTMGATLTNNPEANASQMTKDTNAIFDGLVMTIKIGKDGYSQGIMNWEQIAEASDQVLEITRKVLLDSGMPSAEVEQAIATARRRSGTRAAIEQKMTLPLQIMLMPLEGTYSSVPDEYTDELPSPKPGAFMPTRASYQLGKVDREQGVATIIWKQRLDRARAEAATAERNKQSGQAAEVPDYFIPPGGDVRDDAEYKIEIKSGWPIKSTSSRTTVVQGRELKNETIIEQINPGQ